jgi:NIPSNAP protein
VIREQVTIMASQLRIYRIKDGRMAEWLAGWTRGVLPLRRKFGFRIDGAWVISGENTFVWILGYDGPDGFESRDAAYYASEDRKALRPDPAPLIEHAETRLMTSVLES